MMNTLIILFRKGIVIIQRRSPCGLSTTYDYPVTGVPVNSVVIRDMALCQRLLVWNRCVGISPRPSLAFET